MNPYDCPRLIADIGGTYARFALEVAPGQFERALSLRCADHADFHAAVSAYLTTLPEQRLQHAAVAIANPVEGDEVRMTNYHWRFSIEQMRERLALDTLVVVNDFTALAMAVPRLRADEFRQIAGGTRGEGRVIGVLGAGSGLGVSGLIPAGDGWVALGTEGGHASFAPRDEREVDVMRYAWSQFGHVSFERLVSGPGLELVYRARHHRAGRDAAPLSAPEITHLASAGSDATCVEASVELFCTMLGTTAANLAVTLGALGGIFIGGRHRAASGWGLRPFRFPVPLRGQGPIRRLPEGHPDLRDHGGECHFRGRFRHPAVAVAHSRGHAAVCMP